MLMLVWMLVFGGWQDFPSLRTWFNGEEASFPNGLSVYEDKAHSYVEAEMPGLKPEDIEVTVEGRDLTIRGEKREERNRDKTYYRKSTGSFHYTLRLPDYVDVNAEPEVVLENGILRATFPKIAGKQVASRKIAVKGKG